MPLDSEALERLYQDDLRKEQEAAPKGLSIEQLESAFTAQQQEQTRRDAEPSKILPTLSSVYQKAADAVLPFLPKQAKVIKYPGLAAKSTATGFATAGKMIGGAAEWLGRKEPVQDYGPETADPDQFNVATSGTDTAKGITAQGQVDSKAWKSVEETGKMVYDFWKRKADDWAPPPELSKDLTDDPSLILRPDWWAGNAPQVLGTMLPFLIPGTAGAAAGMKLAQLARIGSRGAQIVSSAGGIGGSTLANSLFEGGMAYKAAMEAGADKDQAANVASKVARHNAIWTAMFSATGMFNPFTKGILSKMVMSALSEGGQEVVEERIPEEVMFEEGLGPKPRTRLTPFVLGAIGGAGGGAVIDSAIEYDAENDESLTEGLIQGKAEVLGELVDQMVASGLDRDVAIGRAKPELDKILVEAKRPEPEIPMPEPDSKTEGEGKPLVTDEGKTEQPPAGEPLVTQEGVTEQPGTPQEPVSGEAAPGGPEGGEVATGEPGGPGTATTDIVAMDDYVGKMPKEDFLKSGWTARRSGKQWNIFRPDGSKWGFVSTSKEHPVGSQVKALEEFHRLRVKYENSKPAPVVPEQPPARELDDPYPPPVKPEPTAEPAPAAEPQIDQAEIDRIQAEIDVLKASKKDALAGLKKAWDKAKRGLKKEKTDATVAQEQQAREEYEAERGKWETEIYDKNTMIGRLRKGLPAVDPEAEAAAAAEPEPAPEPGTEPESVDETVKPEGDDGRTVTTTTITPGPNPKKVKPAKAPRASKPEVALKAIQSSRSTLPILHSYLVKDGWIMSTNLNDSMRLKTDLKDGVYNRVGNNYDLQKIPVSDFPEIPDASTWKTEVGKFDRDEFLLALGKAAKSSSSDESRYVLNGVLLKSDGKNVTMVATDGRRMSVIPLSKATMAKGEYILGNSRNFMGGLKGLEGPELRVTQNESMVGFLASNGQVIHRTVEGSFPKWEQVLPKVEKVITLDRPSLAAAVKELMPYVSETDSIRIRAYKDEIELEASNQSTTRKIRIPAKFSSANYVASEGNVVMPMRSDAKGRGAILSMNPQYLADAVANQDSQEVILGYTSAANPVHVSDKAAGKSPSRRKGGKQGMMAPAGESRAVELFGMPGPRPDIDAKQELNAQWVDVTLPTEPAPGFRGSLVPRARLIEKMARDFNLVVRTKLTHQMRKAAGWFESRPEIIRMKQWGEVEVLFHEAFHSIDKVFRRNTGEAYGKNWKVNAIKKYLPDTEQSLAYDELKNLDYDQKKRRMSEGISEYGRLYISTDQAPIRAPHWHKAFMAWAKENTPGLLRNLNETKELYQQYLDQGSENRIISGMDYKGETVPIFEENAKIQRAVDWIKEKFFNELYTLEKVQAEIEKKSGAKYRPSTSASAVAVYAAKKAQGIVRGMVDGKMVDEAGNILGPGLKEILGPIKHTFTDAWKEWRGQKSPEQSTIRKFFAFAAARRGLDLNERKIETGMDIRDMEYVVEKGKAEHPEWVEISDQLTAWSDHLIGWLIRAGGLGEAEAKIMRDMNPVYLPFKRMFMEGGRTTAAGQGMLKSPKALHQIRGASTPIKNPFEAFVEHASEVVNKAHKIRVARLVAEWGETWVELPSTKAGGKWVSTHEGVGKWIVSVLAPQQATKFTLEKLEGQLKEMGVDLADADLGSIMTAFTQSATPSPKHQGWHMVSVWRPKTVRNAEGKTEQVSVRRWYELHPDFYNSLQGVDTLRVDGRVAKFFAGFASVLRLGATGLNMTFGLIFNPFRDFPTYAAYSRRKTATIFDPIAGVWKNLTAEEGSLAYRFKAAGGELSSQMGYDRAAVMSSFDELLMSKLPFGTVLKVAKHPLQALRQMTQVMEMGPRIAELENVYEMSREEHPDWSEEDHFIEAFNAAQDITVNFTRAGAYGKKINQFVAFFNVQSQGPDKMVRAIKENPMGVVIKSFVWMTVPAMLSWYRNKDKEWWKNLDRAYKYNNLFFEAYDDKEGSPVVIRVPIPFEIGTIFQGAMIATLDAMKEDDRRVMYPLIKNFKNWVPPIIPSAISPLVDVALNKDFLGRPIEGEGLKYLPQHKRVKPWTWDIVKALGKPMEAMGIPLSPVQMQHLIYNYLGGLPKQINFLKYQGLPDLPLIGGAIMRAPEKPRRQLQAMFDELTYLREQKAGGEATDAQLDRLSYAEGIYRKLYKPIQDELKISIEKEDVKNTRILYEELAKGLDEAGY